jgi:hypothetical protein
LAAQLLIREQLNSEWLGTCHIFALFVLWKNISFDPLFSFSFLKDQFNIFFFLLIWRGDFAIDSESVWEFDMQCACRWCNRYSQISQSSFQIYSLFVLFVLSPSPFFPLFLFSFPSVLLIIKMNLFFFCYDY